MDKKQIDFFKNTIFATTPKSFDELGKINDANIKIDLTSSNESARIPKKFWNVFAEDFDFNFDIKDFVLQSNNTAKVCLMSGMTGRGKTTAQCCAIHERVRAGFSAGLYFSDLLLAQQLRSTRSFSAKESEFEFYERLGRVPFLAIDEIGTAQDMNEERMFIRSILMLRYDNDVPTMLATNMTNSQFMKFLLGVPITQEFEKEELNSLCKKDPVINRLSSVIVPVVMVGESLR